MIRKMSRQRNPRIAVEGEYMRGTGRLIRVEDVTPKDVVLDYIFQDSEATVQARINGHNIKEYGTFNNLYGEGTCVDAAIEQAKSVLKVIGESNLEFVVVKRTFHQRYRPSKRMNESIFDRGMVHMEVLPHGWGRDLPDDIEEVVWSSNESEGKNADA